MTEETQDTITMAAKIVMIALTPVIMHLVREHRSKHAKIGRNNIGRSKIKSKKAGFHSKSDKKTPQSLATAV